MPYFGYRISLLGPPTVFKCDSDDFCHLYTTPHTVDDPHYPFRFRKISDEEYELSLEELRAKYPPTSLAR